MITDEQIKQALESAGVEFQYFTHARTNKQVCTTEGSVDFEKIASGIRELIALAQQIKPLEFVQDEDGDYAAKSAMGTFLVLKMVLSGFVYNGRSYPTQAEATEAANEDYRKRVLSCLVWGGVRCAKCR